MKIYLTIIKIFISVSIIFLLLISINYSSNFLRNSTILDYFNYCIDYSGHSISNFFTNNDKEFVYTPLSSKVSTSKDLLVLKEKPSVNTKISKTQIIEGINANISDKYIEELTGYSIDDILDFLDDAKQGGIIK